MTFPSHFPEAKIASSQVNLVWSHEALAEAGERERPGWQPEGTPPAPGDLAVDHDAPMRQSVASHASARYEGVADEDLFGSPSPSSQVRCCFCCKYSGDSKLPNVPALRVLGADPGKAEVCSSLWLARKEGDPRIQN